MIENYGNWRSLSFSIKGAYITGVWDSLFIEFTEDRTLKKQVDDFSSCLLEKDFTIGDLVEEIDLLYLSPKYKNFSPLIITAEMTFDITMGDIAFALANKTSIVISSSAKNFFEHLVKNYKSLTKLNRLTILDNNFFYYSILG